MPNWVVGGAGDISEFDSEFWVNALNWNTDTSGYSAPASIPDEDLDWYFDH